MSSHEEARLNPESLGKAPETAGKPEAAAAAAAGVGGVVSGGS